MHPHPADAIDAVLASAELWATDPPTLLSGWEDAFPFCAAVTVTHAGRLLCASCPRSLVGRARDSGRLAAGRCSAGVRLLAVPDRAGGEAIVLRTAAPAPDHAQRAAATANVDPASLVAAARASPRARGHEVRAAVRHLCDPDARRDWQAAQRTRAADDRRGSNAAIAQLLATLDDLGSALETRDRQHAELEAQRRELDRLARALLDAADEERTRLAHEIHDTAAQSMVSAYRFLDAARAMAATSDPLATGHLDTASERLREAIAEVRAVLARLQPPGLEELGLAEALRIRLSRMEADGVAGTVHGALPRLHAPIERALYGMAAEAMSNALRHGGARRIDVRLGVRDASARVEVQDDGRGFDPAAGATPSAGHGLGLVGMARQVEWLGGSLEVSTAPGAGTRICLTIPLPEADAGAGSPPGGRSPGTTGGPDPHNTTP